MDTRIQVEDVAVNFRPEIPDNSLTDLQCYLEESDSDIIVVFQPSFNFPFNSLAEANNLDEFDLSSNNQPLNFFEEQQKMTILELLSTGLRKRLNQLQIILISNCKNTINS